MNIGRTNELLYKKCMLCPRKCGVDRTKSSRGRCGAGAEIRAARAALHMWEEPCISGTRGSGAVFFSGCPLGCIFCQNSAISHENYGFSVTPEELADIFLRLEDEGANNINLVTAVHFTPGVVTALEAARGRGLKIPVVYNSGGYESVSTLRLYEGLVDVYMPDLKYISPGVSYAYSGVGNYFETAKLALDEMYRQVGGAEFSDGSGATEAGIMTRGLLVRHLLLPGQIEDSLEVIAYLHAHFGDDIYISIMNQYTPPQNGSLPPELRRRVTDEEYGRVVSFADKIGVKHGFIQEDGASSDSFVPEFDGTGILPSIPEA
ncbi:MAG: radical SAM protein [Firmicutes bacterium]|nr:radical SAM protein [Bacillota bacterium]